MHMLDITADVYVDSDSDVDADADKGDVRDLAKSMTAY